MPYKESSFYENINQFLAVIYAHYHYYIGVLVRMLIDYNKWTLKSLVSYSLISLMLVDLTRQILIAEAYKPSVILAICLIVGFTGHTGLRYFLDNMLVDILGSIKKRILSMIDKPND